jgi:hypothetical protein
MQSNGTKASNFLTDPMGASGSPTEDHSFDSVPDI